MSVNKYQIYGNIYYENKCINDFIKFLTDHKTTNNGTYTHTCMGRMFDIYCGKFNIPDSENAYFLELYAKILKSSSYKTKKISLHMIEKSLYLGPIFVDFDFKQLYHPRIYTLDTIKYVVGKYNNEISKYLNIPLEYIQAFVFEKENPTHTKNNDYKDGFHIMYPKFAISAKLRYKIFDEVQLKIIKENLLGKMGFTNTIDQMHDDAVIMRNGLVMYGSKKENSHMYELTHIFDDNMIKQNICTNYSVDELVNLLSIRASHNQVFLKDEYNTNTFMEEVEKSYIKRHGQIKPEICGVSSLNSENLENFEKINIDTNIRKIVNLLSVDRATNYTSWIQVGLVLHNIDVNLIDCFKSFSQKCPKKYNEEECDNIWKKMNKEYSMGIESLHFWAKNDNPCAYEELVRQPNTIHISEEKNYQSNIVCI